MSRRMKSTVFFMDNCFARMMYYDNHANRFSNANSTCQMSSMVFSSTLSLVECGSTMRGPMLAIWMPG